ncbi:MAG: hypothetical protein U0703_26770 [Anaerolineae bacterium]
MYLRTPKRYQVGHRRRHLFSLRWLWLWILDAAGGVGRLDGLSGARPA